MPEAPGREADDLTGRSMAEGFAQVVAVEPGAAWLEMEPTAGCASCAAKNGCGVPKASQAAGRQRFRLEDHFGARLGDRVVVGIPESALLNASALAYAVPVLGMIVGAVAAGAAGGGDGVAALAALAGLAAGLLVSRFRAARLAAAGRLSPVYIRHASGAAAGCAFTERR